MKPKPRPCGTCEKPEMFSPKINDKTGERIGCEFAPNCPERKAFIKRLKARINRQCKDDVYKSLGLKKVRGALGGIYYE